MSTDENDLIPSDRICRYIFDKKHFAVSKGRVKYPAFLPPNGEISVYHVTSLSEKEIWDIGLRYVAEVSGRKLRGRGDLLVSDVFSVRLNVKLEKETHPRHANVSGWPPHKGQRILIAKKLEGKACLVVKPPDKSNL
jgi:hypothetical protein